MLQPVLHIITLLANERDSNTTFNAEQNDFRRKGETMEGLWSARGEEGQSIEWIIEIFYLLGCARENSKPEKMTQYSGWTDKISKKWKKLLTISHENLMHISTFYCK